MCSVKCHIPPEHREIEEVKEKQCGEKYFRATEWDLERIWVEWSRPGTDSGRGMLDAMDNRVCLKKRGKITWVLFLLQLFLDDNTIMWKCLCILILNSAHRGFSSTGRSSWQRSLLHLPPPVLWGHALLQANYLWRSESRQGEIPKQMWQLSFPHCKLL